MALTPVVVQSVSKRVGRPCDTSTSFVLVGTGSKSFVVSGNLTYFLGQQVTVVNSALTAGMTGTVTFFSGVNLTINVPADPASLPFMAFHTTTTSGSGTFHDWNIGQETFQLTLPNPITPGNTILFISTGSFYENSRLGYVLPVDTTSEVNGQVTSRGPRTPFFDDEGFWGTGYWRVPTTTVMAVKPVLVGDNGTIVVAVSNTTPPLIGSVELISLEIFGVLIATGKAANRGQNYPPTGSPTFGPFLTYGPSDLRIPVACAGDGASIAIAGTGGDSYTTLEYTSDGNPSSSFVGWTNGSSSSAGFSVTYGNAPTDGGTGTATGYEVWLAQFAAAQPITVALTSSQNPSITGHSVTFSWTVTGTAGHPVPTGSVTLTDSVSGTLATLNLAVGPGDSTGSYTTSALSIEPHTITANYNGDTVYSVASTSLEQFVHAKTPVTVTLTSSQNPIIVGYSILFSINVAGTGGPPTGNVILSDNIGDFSPQTLMLDPAGNASFDTGGLSVNTHIITAAYQGDFNFATGSQFLSQVVVNKFNPFVILVSDFNPQFFGLPLTLTATVLPPSDVSEIPTGLLTLTDSILGLIDSANLDVNGKVTYVMDLFHPWAAGTHLVTAAYFGNADYLSQTAPAVAQVILKTGQIAIDLPGFSLIAVASSHGDTNLPSTATFSAVPSTTSAGHEVSLVWSSVNVASIRIFGTNGTDSLDTGVLGTSGSGTFLVVGGFQDSITLNCFAYDPHGNVATTQTLVVTILEQTGTATFSAVPSTTSAGHEVSLVWSSVNVTSVRIFGNNGTDSLDTGFLGTSGSGTFLVVGGFQQSIILNCFAYDPHGNVATTQTLVVGIPGVTTIA